MNTGNKITVGYVAEVIHHPTGADVYVVTDIELPEKAGGCEAKSVNFSLNSFS